MTVVDLSIFVAGPMTGLILAEMGADVIKVEPPGGDPFRVAGTTRNGLGAWWMSTNRGKRSVVLDLKRARGRELVHRLADGADVLLHSFRPGVAERLGLGYEELSATNERLVHAALSGFGTTGPLARQRVYDNVIQGFVGLNAVQGTGHPDGPQSVRTPIIDKIAPMVLAQAITAALLERERSGRGQRVDVSMLHSALWWLWPDMLMDETFLEPEGVRHGEGPRTFRNLVFATSDGHISAITSTDAEWRAFATAAGRPDWLADPRLGDPDWRQEHRNEVLEVMAAEIRLRPTAEWLVRLAAADAPGGPVNEPEAVLAEEQVRTSGMVAEWDHVLVGRHRQPTAPARFSRSETAVAAAPTLGEHTREVLAGLGLDDTEIDGLVAAGTAGY